MKTILYILAVLFCLYVISKCNQAARETEEENDVKVELTEDQSSLLREVEYNGHVQFKEFSNEIWVKPLFWNVCNYQAKTNLTYLSAIRCGNARGSTDYSCTVYDNMTGKKLAKWDELWGFEIEE